MAFQASAAEPPRQQTAPRSPGLVYGAFVATLLVVLAAVALTINQPPPPTIAEIAPQAIHQIKKASTQSSNAGSGAGPGGTHGPGHGSGAPPPPPKPSAKTVDQAAVLQCVPGNPSRQIDDPQSPPCIAYWKGNNGGATAPGVTGSEITIASPDYDASVDPALEAFFNSHFEFYGRKLNIVPLHGSNSTNDPGSQQADAVKAAKELKAFASSDYGGGNIYYYEKLAQLGVVAASDQPIFDTSTLTRYSPYLWQYPMAIDRMYSNIGSFVCAELAKRPAAYAGPPINDGRTRTFGIIEQLYSADQHSSLGALENQLRGCGAAPAKVVSYVYDLDPQKSTNAVVEMDRANVTSIICLCQVLSMSEMGREASSQTYLPEWLISTYLLTDYDTLFSVGMPSEQRTHAFGLSFIPKQITPPENPVNWAIRGGDPSNSGKSTGTEVNTANIEYRSLLLLAAGIQMAGPKLTAQTFASGLARTTFPNPDTGLFAGHVGLANSHAMTLDAAQIYWGEAQPSPYPDNGNGAFCYVAHGRRFSVGSYPRGTDGFFQGTCDSGVYADNNPR